jgi:3-phenylpropionate/trans-cinnamate dioxygenase ferredoxin reductase subunit
VIERAQLPLLRVLGPRVAQVFADLHRDHGVDLRCDTAVTAVQPAAGDPSSAGAVLLSDGTELEADVIVVGIGVTPNVELARSCGLNVDDGILVSRDLVTSDDDILAAGDVANAYHPLLRRQLRVEHWANALHQPVVAAQTMLGQSASYVRLPYFFTDQYDLGMEYTGYADPDGHDQVVIRGDVERREFIAFWLDGGRLTAAMNVNVRESTEPIQELISSGVQVDAGRLTNLDVPLTHATIG